MEKPYTILEVFVLMHQFSKKVKKDAGNI